MDSLLFISNPCSAPLSSPKCCKTHAPPFTHSLFLSSSSIFRLKEQSLTSTLQLGKLRAVKPRLTPVVYAVQSNFFRVIQTVWKVGKDGIEAGANMVPEAVPRPIARISVGILALTVSLFLLKSILSTAFFAVATMGLVYFIFIGLNKDQGPRGGGGSKSSPMEDPVEEARRIMEKYK